MGETRKKCLDIALWAAAVVSALLFFRLASGLVYDTVAVVFGEAAFVGKNNVVYGDPGQWWATNPEAMVRWRILIGLLMTLLALLASAATFPLLKRRCRHFRRAVCILWMWLLCLGGFGVHTIAVRRVDRFFAELEKCTTPEDHRRLMGAPLLRKSVAPDDEKKLEALASFSRSGFAPGRELVIFANAVPRVLILVWLENGKIVHRDWCYKNSGAGAGTRHFRQRRSARSDPRLAGKRQDRTPRLVL